MTTEAQARRERLGSQVCEHARRVAEAAPDLTPEQQNALAVLLHDNPTKATDQAA